MYELNNWLTVTEVAEILGLSQSQVYSRMHKGDLSYGLYGKNYLIHITALERFIDAGLPLPPPKEGKKILSVIDVARLTGLTTDTVHRLCYNNTFTYDRGSSVGHQGYLKIDRDSVEAYMALYCD